MQMMAYVYKLYMLVNNDNVIIQRQIIRIYDKHQYSNIIYVYITCPVCALTWQMMVYAKKNQAQNFLGIG